MAPPSPLDDDLHDVIATARRERQQRARGFRVIELNHRTRHRGTPQGIRDGAPRATVAGDHDMILER